MRRSFTTLSFTPMGRLEVEQEAGREPYGRGPALTSAEAEEELVARGEEQALFPALLPVN